jgi:hypothetical protein
VRIAGSRQLADETVSGVTDDWPLSDCVPSDVAELLSSYHPSSVPSSGVDVTPPLVTPVGFTVGVDVLADAAECPSSTTTRLANPPKLAAAATALLLRSVRSRASRSGVMGTASSGID